MFAASRESFWTRFWMAASLVRDLTFCFKNVFAFMLTYLLLLMGSRPRPPVR